MWPLLYAQDLFEIWKGLYFGVSFSFMLWYQNWNSQFHSNRKFIWWCYHVLTTARYNRIWILSVIVNLGLTYDIINGIPICNQADILPDLCCYVFSIVHYCLIWNFRIVLIESPNFNFINWTLRFNQTIILYNVVSTCMYSHNKRRRTAKSESRPRRRKNKPCTALDTTQVATFQQKTSKPIITLQKRWCNAHQHTTSMNSTTTLKDDNEQSRNWLYFTRP